MVLANMVRVFILTIFFFGALSSYCQGIKFTRCELVAELRYQDFPENQMRDWVCLIENESSRNTHIKSKKNKDKSYDYGLFQINDKYWCSSTNKPGKDCKVTCADVMTDDITKASTFAKKIYKRHGFKAWYGWRNFCRGKTLPDISECNEYEYDQ